MLFRVPVEFFHGGIANGALRLDLAALVLDGLLTKLIVVLDQLLRAAILHGALLGRDVGIIDVAEELTPRA